MHIATRRLGVRGSAASVQMNDLLRTGVLQILQLLILISGAGGVRREIALPFLCQARAVPSRKVSGNLVAAERGAACWHVGLLFVMQLAVRPGGRQLSRYGGASFGRSAGGNISFFGGVPVRTQT